jgi:hypothetical protein
MMYNIYAKMFKMEHRNLEEYAYTIYSIYIEFMLLGIHIVIKLKNLLFPYIVYPFSLWISSNIGYVCPWLGVDNYVQWESNE